MIAAEIPATFLLRAMGETHRVPTALFFAIAGNVFYCRSCGHGGSHAGFRHSRSCKPGAAELGQSSDGPATAEAGKETLPC